MALVEGSDIPQELLDLVEVDNGGWNKVKRVSHD